MTWSFPEIDFILHWVVSDQNSELATHVVVTCDDTPDEVAHRVVELVA